MKGNDQFINKSSNKVNSPHDPGQVVKGSQTVKKIAFLSCFKYGMELVYDVGLVLELRLELGT